MSDVQIHVACCLRDHTVYIITHNVSSDQSPITVNRTNVTLYGVQPGETYNVEIMPSVTYKSANCSYVCMYSYTGIQFDFNRKWGHMQPPIVW